MILLIHGENTTASQRRLDDLITEYKIKGYGINRLDASKVSLAQWEEAATSRSLLETDILVVAENFFGKNKKAGDFPVPASAELIFYESKKLFKIPSATGLKVEQFNMEPTGFKFLEALAPGKQKLFLPLLEKYSQYEIPEIIFTMIARQIRLLLLAKSGATSGPVEWDKMPDWQKAKLYKQAGTYESGQLEALLSKLLQIDYDIKSGKTNLNLQTHLELLLLTI